MLSELRCFFRAGLSRVNKGILRRSSPGEGFGQSENSRAETAFVNQVKVGRGSGDEDEASSGGGLGECKTRTTSRRLLALALLNCNPFARGQQNQLPSIALIISEVLVFRGEARSTRPGFSTREEPIHELRIVRRFTGTRSAQDPDFPGPGSPGHPRANSWTFSTLSTSEA